MNTRHWILRVTLLVSAGCGGGTWELQTSTSTLRFSWDWDGGHLAYWDDRDGIHVIDAGGTCVRVGPFANGAFAWSRAGTRLAYLANDLFSARLVLFVVRADGTDRRRIVDAPAFGALRWAPDGSRLAFVAGDALYTVHAGGSGLSRIDGAATLADVAWSPDSSRIAYRASLELRTARPDGADLHVVSGGVAAGIAWTHDGAHVLYRADGLFAAAPDGTGRRRLSAQHEVIDFAASPAGPWVAYSTAAHQLWIADVTTGGPALVADAGEYAWSPDGARLAYRTVSQRLYTLDPATGATVEIDAYVAAGFLWSPNGQTLAYRSASGMLHVATRDGAQVIPIAECRPGFSWDPGGGHLLYVWNGVFTARVADGFIASISTGDVVGTPAWGGTRIAFRLRAPGGAVELYLAWSFGGAVRVACSS